MSYDRLPYSSGSIVAATLAAAGIAFSVNEVRKPDATGCDAQLTSPLSWVGCPLVDVRNMISGGVEGGLLDQMEDVPPPDEVEKGRE